MKTKFVFALLVILPIYLSAQIDLTNRNSISIYGGTIINNASAASVGIGTVETETTVLGLINYEYHFSDEWSLGISTGIFSVASKASYNGVSSIMVFPALLDFQYYPKQLTFGKSARGYAGLGIGVYTAKADKVGILPIIVSSIDETVFGVRPNVGVDFYPTNWLKVGPNISYHLMSDFSVVVGERKNYSGPAFSLRFGFMF